MDRSTLDALPVTWFTAVIRQLPADDPVPDGTQGYNEYATQKAHWLGWLDPSAGTGSYQRRPARVDTARAVYNRIVEPKMLLWLITAAGVAEARVRDAQLVASQATTLASKSAAIRRSVPWPVVAEALGKKM